MRKNSNSILGHIMNLLGIQTSAMAQALHVDASLVSKWKSGARHLNKNSAYFDDVIDYILESGGDDRYEALRSALNDIFPQGLSDDTNDDPDTEQLLRRALADGAAVQTVSDNRLTSGLTTIPTAVFDGNAGRRDAVKRLLEYACSMEEPGELTFIDSDEFRWMTDDREYSLYFKDTMLSLLDRGFHAVFVIHYSPLKENFKNFFVLCSSVIFHRNADWYYSVYYDESIIKSSVFMVNHAALMLGLSVACSAETTMIFTDKSMIIRQREMISELIKRCLPIFNDFGPFELSRIVDAVIQFRHGGVFYSFLPVPAFIAVNPTLLKNILISNDIDKKTIEKVMELNGDFRRMTDSYLSCGTENNERYIYIFQLEKLLERVRKRTFTSNSLTHSCGKKTVITPKHHAAELRCLISLLETRKNVQIVIASEKDSVFMPQMNCWCKENGYVMLMDRKGFRSCDEGIIVNAASAALEDCVRRVPPERKERDSVISILNDLAEELERDA